MRPCWRVHRKLSASKDTIWILNAQKSKLFFVLNQSALNRFVIYFQTLTMWPLLLFAGIGGVYLFLRSVYRVFFHPLRKFPGPKLAAITHGVEFYHDVIRNGRYLWEIERMHQRYGQHSAEETPSRRSNPLQAQSSASIPVNFTSKIPTITTRSMLQLRGGERKIQSLWVSLDSRHR